MPQDTPVTRYSQIIKELDTMYSTWNTSGATLEELNALKTEAEGIAGQLGIPFIYHPPVSEHNAALIEAGEYTEDEPEDSETEDPEDSEGDYYYSSERYYDSDC